MSRKGNSGQEWAGEGSQIKKQEWKHNGLEKEKGVKTTGGRKEEKNVGITIEVMSSIIISLFESAQLGLRTFKELGLTVEGRT